ncbi:MAG: alpha/beta hydrolase [Planctomycetes bacterium]|nr:alpha/beta hydrolase [Planctomycetota bacterium]
MQSHLEAGSQVVHTAAGPVEYARSGSGPVILGLHGTPGGYDQTQLLFQEFTRHGFTLVAPSRPGYLRTPLSTGRTYMEQADAMIALLDTLAIDRVLLAAVSGGGPVALQIALRHPDRVSALLLECAVTRRYVLNLTRSNRLAFSFLLSHPGNWLLNVMGHYWPGLIVRGVIHKAHERDGALARSMFRHVMAHAGKVQGVKDWLRTLSPLALRKVGLENDLEQLAGIGSWPLEQITAPTLIVHGTRDAEVPYGDAEFLAGRLARAELVCVPEGLHLLFFSEQWTALRGAELDFLRRHAPGLSA